MAALHFGQADQKAGHDDVYMHLYMSYQGLCLLLSGDSSGLNLCRYAASMETLQPAVFLHLAIAGLKLRHRKRACSALRLVSDLIPNMPGYLSCVPALVCGACRG